MGARFEALNEGVLAAASKSTGYFFAISISQKVRCLDEGVLAAAWKSTGYFFAISIFLEVWWIVLN